MKWIGLRRGRGRRVSSLNMRDESLRFQLWLSVGLIVVGLLIGVAHYISRPVTWADIERDGRLIVLTQNAATTYYEGRDGEPTGFEYELVRGFAEHLGVKAEFVVKDSVSELLEALEKGRGHLAAANLTPTEGRAARFLFSPHYLKIRQLLVCNRYGNWPRRLEDLPGHSLEVTAGSSYEATLWRLREKLPELTWSAANTRDTDELFEHVAEKKVDCTVADSNIVAINRRYYPELIVPFHLTEKQGLAWAMPAGSGQMKHALDTWFAQKQTHEMIARLKERFYDQVEKFDFVDLARFRRRIKTRLPNYRARFEAVAGWHDLPWVLLAAVSYQESHWDPDAQSATGVRGLMMLTMQTAQHLGVKDREDPAQSIAGGAKYLADLLERVPDSVEGRDRLWFALAAYNVGMGHVYDARRLARKLGRNPDDWIELSKVLPLLSRKKYYTMEGIRHGYARGGEPVRYVRRVRQYMSILEREFGS